MAFDVGYTGKKGFTANAQTLTFAPGVPYDAIQFILAWAGAGVGDSLAIQCSPDGINFVDIPGSPWTPADDAVIQTVVRAAQFKLTYTKAAGDVGVFIDAVEYNAQQSKNTGPYVILEDGGSLKSSV